MDYALEKLDRIIASARTQVIVAAVSAIVAVIVVAFLSAPEFLDAVISIVTSFLQFAWDYVTSPNPPMPAGDLTMRLIRLWSLHIVEVEFPRLREVA
jgi:hypothetical protein